MFDLNLKNYGYFQFLVCVVLNILGLIFIYSSSNGNIASFRTQLLISIGSMIMCIVISILNMKWVMSRPSIFLIIATVLLLLVQITGTAFNRNAVRWIEIPVINMQLQPSEFAKILMILTLSKYIEKMGTQINQFSNLIKVIGVFAIPFILIFIQPNLSSAIILFVIFFAMLFASKLKIEWFALALGGIALVFLVVFLSVKFGFIQKLPLLRDYQKNRIISFFEPSGKSESTYQQENSITAIGSGKLIGKGINNNLPNSVKNGKWLAESQNDFIFAVVGEEIGFLGSVFIVILYIYLVVSCISIASKQREYYKNLICMGVASWIGIQGFVNIGVATGLIPNTGVPLPFFSQGGSSLMAIYIAMGFVLNIRREVRI